MSKTDQKAPKTAKKTPKKVSKSAAATMATRSATATKSKSAEDEDSQMNTLTTATEKALTTATTSSSKSATATAMTPKSDGQSSEVDQVVEKILAMVMSRGDKQDNQIDRMADIMRTMTDEIKSIKESYRTLAESYLKLQLRVNKQESEVGDIKADFQTVDSAAGTVKETDSSEIFKELAWREERSRELILFKIDESESNSWNETKTYERTELVKTISKVCDFDESEVVFIRRVGVKTPNGVRPVVVGLKSTSRRDEIVAGGRRARIGIDENLTPKQLENKRKVKDEIKLKNGREGNHVYKLVGSAGNYKSVRCQNHTIAKIKD
jgi:archaellum component FlaC